ncbi:thiamine biosynthesis protein ApbE [Stenotrophomonas panacihumi]|uniref:FAD:protein FMN transferase n=1 Tax=Stenotrophomonas panacihumi TaxID=676599 RepID=A0A0R0AYW0_9GAMM|nr:FAD:protein FMN transferase [Stenotrophomonas panacihumi]KRG46974.1 thiamine biosynthesis protein ApbE [Stenotrophomonas panacihumi]PTN54189.1 FAD:protein FMN transferase [Stenotrophomonas panacihumi]
MNHDTLLDREVAGLGGTTMGTTWGVRLSVRRGRDLHGLHAGIQATLDDVVAQMSNWEADSDISRYNRAARGTLQRLPTGFAHVMSVALEVAQASQGAFDPTLGPMVALWGFGASRGPMRVPSDAERAATATRVGWCRLVWDAGSRELLQPGGMELDLSAIAKGYGVDAVAAYLRHAGVEAALVEVGGELYGYGDKPDGQPWRVLVESAPEEDLASELPPRVLTLRDLAVATSGDRWHHFDANDERYSHTFDPRLRRPVPRAPAAVTVAAADTTRADAWATAMTVLGPEQGLALAERLQLAVRFLARDAGGLRESMSSAFEALLEATA